MQWIPLRRVKFYLKRMIAGKEESDFIILHGVRPAAVLIPMSRYEALTRQSMGSH